MAKNGKVTKEKIGYSGPQNAPLFQKPPFYYRNVEDITVYYETDEEAALELLPEDLELTDPPIVSIRLFDAPFTTLGPYSAAVIKLGCLWQGQPKAFVCYQLVTSDSAMAAGREIWGYPKKIGTIEIVKDNQFITAIVERPKNIRLCTALIKPEEPIDETAIPSEVPQLGPAINLKVIPGGTQSGAPALVQLVESGGSGNVRECWRGTGSLTFDHPSPIDPWHRLTIKNIIGVYYNITDSVLSLGSVLKTY
jgi:acetoacetate decarboxylase